MQGDYSDDDDETETELEDAAKRGATYRTDWMMDGEDEKITTNPALNFSRTVRIFHVSRKVMDWLEDGELVMSVKGCSPTSLAKEDHKIREEKKDEEVRLLALKAQREKERQFAEATAAKLAKENEELQKKMQQRLKGLEGFAEAQLKVDKLENELAEENIKATDAWQKADKLQEQVEQHHKEVEVMLNKREKDLYKNTGEVEKVEKTMNAKINQIASEETTLLQKTDVAAKMNQKAHRHVEAAESATAEAEARYALVAAKTTSAKQAVERARMRVDKLEERALKGSCMCVVS